MTSIDKYLKIFEDYFNGDMEAVAQRAFEEALERDGEMRAAWEEYNAMMQAFSDKEAIALRLQLEEAYYRQSLTHHLRYMPGNLWFRLSAAAVLLLIALSIWYFYSSMHEIPLFTDDRQEILHDSTSITDESLPDSLATDSNAQREDLKHGAIPLKQIASLYDREEYQISPVFAELLHSVYRSSWFHLLTPADSSLFTSGDSLLFTWETNIKDSLYFDVLDRHGSVIYKQKGAITSPFTYKPKLPPAIYMFRFATKDEPVWMGVMVEKE